MKSYIDSGQLSRKYTRRDNEESMLHSLLIFRWLLCFFSSPHYFHVILLNKLEVTNHKAPKNPSGKIKSHPFVACAALFWSNREPKRGKEEVSLCQEGGGQSGCCC